MITKIPLCPPVLSEAITSQVCRKHGFVILLIKLISGRYQIRQRSSSGDSERNREFTLQPGSKQSKLLTHQGEHCRCPFPSAAVTDDLNALLKMTSEQGK